MKIKDNKFLLSILLVSFLFNLNTYYHKKNSSIYFKIFIDHLYSELNTSIALIEDFTLIEDSNVDNINNKFDTLNQSLNSNITLIEDTSVTLTEEVNVDNINNKFDTLNQSLNSINWMINKAPLYSEAIPGIQFYSLNTIMHAINLGTTHNDVYIPAFGKKDKLSISEVVSLVELQKLLIEIRDGLQNDSKELNENLSPNQVENLFRNINQYYSNNTEHLFFHYKFFDLYLLHFQE